MTTQLIKTQIDELTNEAPKVSFNKYIENRDNYTSFNKDEDYTISPLKEDAHLVAIFTNPVDQQNFLVKTKNDEYFIIEEDVDNPDLTPKAVAIDDDTYTVDVYNEETDEFEERDLTFEEVVLFSLKNLFYEESATFLTEEDAVKYPLI